MRFNERNHLIMCTSCNCGTASDSVESIQIASTAVQPQTNSYTVTGMTCGHCVASVTEEVQAIEGVRDVAVDLASGTLTFTSDQAVSRNAVEDAVREAGYALA